MSRQIIIMKRTIKIYSAFTFTNSGLHNSLIKVAFFMFVLSVVLSVESSVNPSMKTSQSIQPSADSSSSAALVTVTTKSSVETQTTAAKSSKIASTAPSASSSTTMLTSTVQTLKTTRPTSTTQLTSPTTHVSRKATSTGATSPINTSPSSGPPQTVSSANEETTVVTNGGSDTSSATTSPRETNPAMSVFHTTTNQSTASTRKLSTTALTTGNARNSDTMTPNTTLPVSLESTTKTIASTSVTDNSTQESSNQTTTTTIPPSLTQKQQNGTGMANTKPLTVANTSFPSPSTTTLQSSTQSGISLNQGEVSITSPAASMAENKTVTDAATHTISGTTVNTVSNATTRSPTNNTANTVINVTDKPATAVTSNTSNNVSTDTISSAPTSTNTGSITHIVSNFTKTVINTKTEYVSNPTTTTNAAATANVFNHSAIKTTIVDTLNTRTNAISYTVVNATTNAINKSTIKSTTAVFNASVKTNTGATTVTGKASTNTSTNATTKPISNAITNTKNNATLKPTTDASPNRDTNATMSYVPSATSETTYNSTTDINTATIITGSKLSTNTLAAATTNRFANASTNTNIGGTTISTGVVTTIQTITGASLNNHTSTSTVSSVITAPGVQKTTIISSATVNTTRTALTTASSRHQTNMSSVGSSLINPTANTSDQSTQLASFIKIASTAPVPIATHSSASPISANATESTSSFSTKSASTMLNPSPSSNSSKATGQASTSSTTKATTTIDPCATLVCQNGGTCSSNGSLASCTCAAGYTGLNCSVDIDDCSGIPCKHGATCTDLVNGFNCSCEPGYTGATCDTDVDECSSSPCQHSSNCTNLVNGFNCTCAPGYTGNTCETDIDDCLPNPCRNGGSCTDLVNDYDCTCSAGYTGDLCQTNINECQSNPCKHGNCTDLVNGYKCTCSAGYTGDQCQRDINECDSSPCKNGGQCNDLVDGFNCTCAAGFNGTVCENNIDDCVNSKCQNGATCQDGVNNYTCICLQGWEGPYCSKDVDECTAKKHNCSKFADCINKNGSYSCNCHSGFNGDGFTCVDIDECNNSSLNGCVNGTCFNLYGSFACVCNDGWEGANCSKDIDECKNTNACPANSTCTNLKGSHSCSCKDGYREEDDKCIYKVLYEIPTDKWQTINSIHEDDGIRRVNLNHPILYFKKLYFVAYVSANGYVSLGKRYNARIPPKSLDGWPLDPPIIAPLWADIDPSLNDSGVYISQLSSDHNSENLKTLNAAVGFEPTFALMVTWKNAPPYPAVETLNSEAGNFQMVIATNGSRTSIILNYDRTEFKWKYAPGRHVAMGYFDDTNRTAFLQFTDTNFFLAKIGRNKNVPVGRWVYSVASSSDPVISNEARCRNIALRKSIQERVWEQSHGFEPCPCTLAQAWRDRRFRYTGGKINVHKFRSTLAFGLLGKRRLCHYNDNGILLRGYPNGGYLDVNLKGFTMQDLYEDCCIHTHLCDLFFYMNPSDTCSNYRPPSWAFGWGDPHITTLDGTEYTFNGRGEYVFARTSTDVGSLEVQVRTELVSNTTNDSTIFVGIAAKQSSVPDFGDVIEILLNRTMRTVDVLLNHTYNTTYKAGDDIEIKGENFMLYNESEELVLVFPSGFSLQIGVSDILSIVANAGRNGDSLANMTGLLGNNDGDDTNDFVARNGTLFDVSSSEEQLWSFGTSWMLENRNTSLFSYSGGLDFAYFNNPMIKPKFFINDVNNITAFLSENCGTSVTAAEVNETCKGNNACEVDMTLTCSKTFGERTKQDQTINTKTAKISGNQPPMIDGPTDILVHVIHGQAETSFIKVEDDSDQLADIKVEINTSVYASFKKLNDTTYELQWNNTVLYSTDPAPYFRLVATDSMNATTEYWPALYYCDCTRLGECTFNIGSVQNGTAEKFVKLSCQCDSGWTGERCETKITPCSESPCYNKTSCTVVHGKPKCGPCPDGLTGNGTKCYDVNECETGEAKCSQDCENALGSYRCKCRYGYKLGSDNSSCIDIDECQNMENNCSLAANEICRNTNGSYECRCRSGFVNESNSCIEALSQFVGVLSYSMDRYDRDVSAILKAFLWKIFNTSELALVSIEIVPLQEIHRTYRSVHLPILKTTRYILNSNKHMESQTAARLWNNYQQSSVCVGETCRQLVKDVGLSVNTRDSKIYEDSDNMLCEVEHSRCDPVSTRCFSVSGRMYCQCKAGFTKLDYYLDRCDDINECANSNPCVGGTCVNTPGNYTCYCPAGYSFISGVCTDLCNPSPCQNGGTCIHGQQENEYICKCDGKWAGQTCERENEEASRLQTTLIAVGASIGGVCFLLLVTLFGVCRRSRKRYESYLNRRAMSSINGYEGSKLQFYDAPYDDDMSGPSTFTIPRPQVKKSQYEMQENGSGSELGLIEDDGAAKFDDPSKPKVEAKKEPEEGQGNLSFLHSEGSIKDERKRSKNPYEYF